MGTRLARVMATDDSESPDSFKLAFQILSESVQNLRYPKTKVESRRRSHLGSSDGHFQIEESSGDLVLLRKLSPALKFYLNISVTDDKDMKATIEVEINVQDVNDHAPKFDPESYQFEVDEGRPHKLIFKS